jgi:membrane protein
LDRRSSTSAASKPRKRTSLWWLGGLTPWQLAKRVWREIIEDEVFTRSAALAYYFFSSLIPMLFFLMAVLGIFAGLSGHLRATLLNYFSRVAPPEAFSLIEKALTEINRSSSGLKLFFGLAFSLWAGAGGMSSIMDALNRCYHLKESRPYWKRMLVALALTVAIAGLAVCALVIVLYGGSIAHLVGRYTGLSHQAVLMWEIVQFLLALFFLLSAFALIYYRAPDGKQEWRWITSGSLAGVALWVGVSLLFRLYLQFYNRYSKTYGSLGAVIVLLLWLYITGLSILVGGEINSEIENAAAERGHLEAREAGE